MLIKKKYCISTPKDHRKEYGQYFTPNLISALMVKWVLKNKPCKVLDPAFGLGVFYDEFKKNTSSKGLNFYAYEIDEQILNHYQSNTNLNNTNLYLKRKDFLFEDYKVYNSIICNPPYMKIKNIKERKKIINTLSKKIGIDISGNINSSSIFLLKSLFQLNDNGNLAFIMPYEFFNTNYGVMVKRYLTENRFLKQIVILNNEKDIFLETTTTICILLCKKDYKNDLIKISQVNNIQELKSINCLEEFYQYKINGDFLMPNIKKKRQIVYDVPLLNG